MYRVIKHYGHDNGLSCCFRQWKANSHCHQLHGYALAFTFVFEAKELDSRNWVIDFGDLDGLKRALKETFDHKLIIALDDPYLEELVALREHGLAEVLVMSRTGCEAFAEHAFELCMNQLRAHKQTDRVRLVSCTVAEHGANSATYCPEGV